MSPLKSKAQLGRFEQLVKEGKMKPEVLEKWKSETPNIGALPERIKPTGLDRLKVKTVKVIK